MLSVPTWPLRLLLAQEKIKKQSNELNKRLKPSRQLKCVTHISLSGVQVSDTEICI